VSSRDLTLAIWAAIGFCFVAVCVLSGFRRDIVVTPRTVVEKLMSRVVGWVFLVLGWMWLGWHLFAR
jgi:Family of unknown function (DUF6186)